jgi:hypothetical protein
MYCGCLDLNFFFPFLSLRANLDLPIPISVEAGPSAPHRRRRGPIRSLADRAIVSTAGGSGKPRQRRRGPHAMHSIRQSLCVSCSLLPPSSLVPTGSRTCSRASHPCRIGRCYSWTPSAPTGCLCPHCPSGSHLTRSLICLFQSFPLPHLIYSYLPSSFHSLSFSQF